MRYLFAGSGPPLIFVAGLLGFSFSWTENLAFFAEKFTVYAPDLLNTGYSDPAPSSECFLHSLAEQIREFMDAVGVGRASLIGSSHGATLVLLLAAIQPERVERIVPCAPPHPWSNEPNRLSVRVYASALGPFLGAVARAVPRPLRWLSLYTVYAHPHRARPGTVEGYANAMLRKPSIDYLLRVLHCWKNDFARLADLLTGVSCPVLLVWGTKDRVVPLRTAAPLQAHLACAELSTFPDCGHLPYEELPDEFNTRVREWLLRPLQELC